MTPKDYLLISWMSYLDLPALYAELLDRRGRVPLAAFADSILRMDRAGELRCVRLYDAARDAAREMLSLPGAIVEYVNSNTGSGLVAYVIQMPEETVVAFRGSERAGECVSSNIDWVDNVCEPFVGSVQMEEIERIAQAYPQGKVVFTGHSKGAHNAMATLALSENPQAQAVVFNGQGFAADALTVEQQATLSQRAVNYVVYRDPVGALLYHPERRIYVQGPEKGDPHRPEAYRFDEAGQPIPARRSLGSRVIEGTTRIAERWIRKRGGVAAKKLCRAVLPQGSISHGQRGPGML